MDSNQQFFVKILSDHLHRANTEISYEIDWDEILRLSKSHQVEGIVYNQCKRFMPPDVLRVFDSITSTTLYYYVNRKVALNEISKKLNENGISYIVVKGFSIAEYYPIPALRTMGDSDIIVHRKDMPATMNVMRSAGYEGIDNDKADSWECVKNKITIEIHDRLVSDVDFLKPNQERFFNEYDKYVVNGELDWNIHFLFIMIHLRKHFMNTGVGIRQFMDLTVLILNCRELEWTRIEEKLADLDLLRFTQTCFLLLEKWFGINLPINCDSVTIDQGFYEQVTEKILKNGVFGKDDISNIDNYARNVLINSSGWMMCRRIKYIIRKAFPSYEYMKSYSGCSYVDGRPYLLIIAWLHRFYNYTKHKDRNSVKRVMDRAFIDGESLEKQYDFHKRMGL